MTNETLDKWRLTDRQGEHTQEPIGHSTQLWGWLLTMNRTNYLPIRRRKIDVDRKIRFVYEKKDEARRRNKEDKDDENVDEKIVRRTMEDRGKYMEVSYMTMTCDNNTILHDINETHNTITWQRSWPIIGDIGSSDGNQ